MRSAIEVTWCRIDERNNGRFLRLGRREREVPRFESQSSSFDEVLPNLQESLFDPKDHVSRPIGEMMIDLFESLWQTAGQFHPLPQTVRHVGSFHGLHIQIADA